MNQQNIVTKNGVRYLVCEPASFLRGRCPVFDEIINNGRVFAVNLDTNKLVSITTEKSKHTLSYHLSVNNTAGRKLARDIDVALIQIDDHFGAGAVSTATFTIRDESGGIIFLTTLSRCKDRKEFCRQICYAYNNIK